MIEVRNLHKEFGKVTVLDDVHFGINKPGIYAILGPNGSGKTTLLKSILGMVIQLGVPFHSTIPGGRPHHTPS